jgi:PAS domain-containing protein
MTSDDDSKLISGTFDISGDGVKKKYSMDNLNVDKDCIATVGFSVEQRNAINKINIYNVKVEQLPEKANTAVTKDNLKAPEKDTSDSGEDIGGITPSILILTFLFSLAIIKYRIFDTIPVSFGKFIENVKIGVMILDISNKITYTNPAFLRLFSSVPVLNANGSITGFLDQLSEAVKNKNEFEVIKQKILSQRDLQHIEFYADLYTKKRYQINVQPILDHDTGYIGKIISFNDISRQKRLQDELALRNQKLEEYNVAVEDLAVTRERNRMQGIFMTPYHMNY